MLDNSHALCCLCTFPRKPVAIGIHVDELFMYVTLIIRIKNIKPS